MISVQRILPYTKQLVLYALYDVLDSEESEYDKAENGRIAAKVTVYGNQKRIYAVRVRTAARYRPDCGDQRPLWWAFPAGRAACGGLSGRPGGTAAGKRAENLGSDKDKRRKRNMNTKTRKTGIRAGGNTAQPVLIGGAAANDDVCTGYRHHHLWVRGQRQHMEHGERQRRKPVRLYRSDKLRFI